MRPIPYLLAQADALNIPLADDSVHCIPFSPPYWGLRSYGDEDEEPDDRELGSEWLPDCESWTGNDWTGRPGRDLCDHCHVCAIRRLFRELRRVLHPTGTIWLNYGDMYAQERPRGRYGDQGNLGTGDHGELGPRRSLAAMAQVGIKKGDMVLMPERLALALQKDGFWVRSRIVWEKTNPMPGPAQQWRRPVNSYEFIYLFAKTWDYYYDAESVREEPANYTRKGGTATYTANTPGINHGKGSKTLHQMAPNGRHKRDVWRIATQPWKGYHFAAFPEELARTMILAGTSEHGVCPSCGWPYERVIDYKSETRETVAWVPTCDCADDWPPAPAIVYDPMVGTGTVVKAANDLGRIGLGSDLYYQYLRTQAWERLGLDEPQLSLI